MPQLVRFVEPRSRRTTARRALLTKLPTDGIPNRGLDMTILAQDPSVRESGKEILRTALTIPSERLEPGPRGHRFYVIDYDASTRTLTKPVPIHQDADLGYDDPFKTAADGVLLTDPAFHAQNCFAIATHTLDVFETSLGRRVPWSFGGHQVYLVPHAFQEANAYYAREDHAVYFGYFIDERKHRINTSLSFDVVAHEVTHAILDGLRSGYQEPGLPDQAAFHEAFADIVALLSAFSLRGLVQGALGLPDTQGLIKSEAVNEVRLDDSVLLGVAEELGHSIRGTDEALRTSVKLPKGDAWKRDPTFDEPHRRGEVLVAAMMHALLRVWEQRLKALIIHELLSRDRAAEEGVKAAQHLLAMAIRCIDYCPPVEFEFADFLDALLTSDEEMSPDDELDYRGAVRTAFAEYGITQPRGLLVDLAKKTPTYAGFNYVRMRTDPDELFRFIWENRDIFGIDLSYFTDVSNLRDTQRTGPDGFVVEEALVDYVQTVQGKPAELERKLKTTLPAGLPKDKDVQIRGGGVIVFDQFGRAKYHQRKPIDDAARQRRRLEYLVRTDQHDTRGRFGFALGAQIGQRFAEIHRRPSPEEW